MGVTRITSRDFNHDVGAAKRASKAGPVVITDRGQPAYVLLSHEDYRKLLGSRPSILEQLAVPGADEFEFEPPRMGEGIFRPAEFDPDEVD